VSTTVVSLVRFESAHFLPHVPETHKCRRMHGHSYRCEVHVTGPVDPRLGWVIDYADIRAAFEPLRARLDHHLLNEIPGLDNPTSETIVAWIWRELSASLPGLSRLVLYETESSFVIYTGP
jgi:6-pyruvoyltetrahydropterin/6-carboxytetrahydropterin synthase